VVVFTEWIDLATGIPGTTGSRPMPMTVMKYSIDRGTTWSNRYVLNWLNLEKTGVPPSPRGWASSAP